MRHYFICIIWQTAIVHGDMDERVLLHIAGGHWTITVNLESNLVTSVTIKRIHFPSIPGPGNLFYRNESTSKDICKKMFYCSIARSCKKNWASRKSLSIGWWLNKWYYIQTIKMMQSLKTEALGLYQVAWGTSMRNYELKITQKPI